MSETVVTTAGSNLAVNGDHVHGLLIDGEVRAGGGEVLELVNPATGHIFARCHSADAQDTDHAVRSARAAFDSGVWSHMPIHQRARILNRFGDLLERDVLRQVRQDDPLPAGQRSDRGGDPLRRGRHGADQLDGAHVLLQMLSGHVIPTWRVPVGAT